MFCNKSNNNQIKRAITSSQWSRNHVIDEKVIIKRLSTISMNSSDAESLVGNSPLMSPFGSPVKHSTNKWFESENALNIHLDENILNPKKWTSLETERIDSKNDFNKNGIDVPFNESIDSMKKYELFGKNYFTCANFEPTVSPINKSMGFVREKPKRRPKTQMFCAFCKNNNETEGMFNSHILKDPEGKIVCPILRNYHCPNCKNNGGDEAHTLRYCPLNKSGTQYPSIMKLLKSSRSADGKRRSN